MANRTRNRGAGDVRTIKAMQLKAALKVIAEGIRTVEQEMNHLKDDVEITIEMKSGPGTQRSPGNVMEEIIIPLPRPATPSCHPDPFVTAGQIEETLQILQTRLDACRLVVSALGSRYVIR